MAFRYFPGKAKAWLEARLSELLDDQAAGTMTTQAGAGDVNATSSLQLGLGERKRKLLYDLNQVDPTGNWLQHVGPTVSKAVFLDQ